MSTTIEELESELADLQAAYVSVCDQLHALTAPTPTVPTITSRVHPVHTVLHEYLPCPKTGAMWARTGRELYTERACATVALPDGRVLAFRKRSHAQAWIAAGMPPFVSEYEA